MAYQYDYGPGPGQAFNLGIQSAFGGYDAQKERRRLQDEEAWRREEREHTRGLRPLQRRQAETSVAAGEFGLRSAQRQYDWAGEDRPYVQGNLRRQSEMSDLQFSEARDRAGQAATVRAMRALKINQPTLAVAEYLKFDPKYHGVMPRPDPNRPGNWLLDLDGDGVLDSVNPDMVISAYVPQQSRFSESERGILNTGTGEFRPHYGSLQIPEGPVRPVADGGLDLYATAAEGTGLWSAARQGINNLIGPFVTGQPFPETESARNTMRLFQQQAKEALVLSRRFPVHEQKLLEGMLPSPDRIFRDSDGERMKLVQLHRYLTERQAQNQGSIQSGRITPKQRMDLMEQNESINRVLGMMGPIPDQPDRYGQGQRIHPPMPRIGQIIDGWTYQGGDPANPHSWVQSR